MKCFKYSLFLSTFLFFNPQNSWGMDSAEFKDLRGLPHKTKFYKLGITDDGEIQFTQCRFGKGEGNIIQPEKISSKFLETMTINDRCEIIGETDAQPEKVVNTVDRRIREHKTADVPHRFQGQMTMTFPNGKRYTGSGTMISPHHVLTAGHNLYSHGDEGWATSVKFVPGRNEEVQPFGEIKGEILLSPKEWTQENSKLHDYGIVVLEKDIGRDTGWAGLLVLPDDQLNRTELCVSGYPVDKGATQLWSMKGKSTKFDSDTLSYKIDTMPGQSGSGVFMHDIEETYVFNQKGYYILGIHAYGGRIENSATRLTIKKFEKLTTWMRDPYMSPPCQGVSYFTSHEKFKEIINTTIQIEAVTNTVLNLEEKNKLNSERDALREALTKNMKDWIIDRDYTPKSTITDMQRTKVDKMFTKGIIVSNHLNESGNLRLITRQVETAKNALQDINTFLTNILTTNSQLPPEEELAIREFQREYEKFIKINLLDGLVSRDPEMSWIRNYFKNPANETLPFTDLTRYESWTPDSVRKDQINSSKLSGIPVRHRGTPMANLIRGERTLDLQDELLKQGFELQKRWRMPRKETHQQLQNSIQ